MRNYILTLFSWAALIGCSQQSADMRERDRYCRGDDCYLESSKLSGPVNSSNESGWVATPGAMERDPNSGSDQPLITWGSSTGGDDVPTDVGCVEPCGTEMPGEGRDTSNPDMTPDREPPGKGNVFTRLGNDIGKAFSGVAGALNGSNNKKRKKAREAQKALEDASDVMQQASDYGTSINAETQAISNLAGSVASAQKVFTASTSEEAFRGVAQRYNARTRGILEKTPDVDEKTLTGVREQGIYPEAAKVEDGKKYVKYAAVRVERFKEQADYEARKDLVTMADEAMNASEESYKEGSPQEGNFYYEIGMTLADIALSVTPVIGTGKDFVEAAWGKSLLDGRKLTSVERSMAVVGVLTLGFGKVGVIGKFGKLGRIIGKAGRGGDDAANAAKALENGAAIALQAEKAGIKSKKALEDIVEELKIGSPCNFVETKPKFNFWHLLESTAYAADCLPGQGEKLLEGALAGYASAKTQVAEITSLTVKWPEGGHALERLLQRDISLDQAKRVVDEGRKFYDSTQGSIVFFADRTAILGTSGTTKLIGVAVDGGTRNVKTVLRESRIIDKLPKGRFLPL